MKPGILVCGCGFAGAAGQPNRPGRPPARRGAEYSDAAKAAGLQGTETLFVEIHDMARWTRVEIVQSLGCRLDEKALDAVNRWTFRTGIAEWATGSQRFRNAFPVFGRGLAFSKAPYRVERPKLAKPRRTHDALAASTWRLGRQYAGAHPGLPGLQFAIGAGGIPSDGHAFDPHNRPINVAIDWAAVEAVKAWRFDPGVFNGKSTLGG